MRIEKLRNCTGCHGCYSICPNNAIFMKENEEGFLFPEIDKSKCIDCKLCEKVCPVIGPIQKEKENTTAYAAINKNEQIRLNSSSGGIFTALAEKVIDDGGVVFGAKFAEDFTVIHSWTETKEGLADFRGSKYVQSVIGDSYKDCKNFLLDNRKVLFSGTPCQIQGLKKYLGQEYENLLTVDFICHGVPSPLLWKKYIEFREKKAASQTVKTAFRRKNDGWKQYSLSFTYANDSEYCVCHRKDPYMQIFLKDFALRTSCYDCPCRGITRTSDITLADFWGIQNLLPKMDDDKGISFVIIHSRKGAVFFNLLENCNIEEISVLDGATYNKSIEVSPKYMEQRKDFYINLHNQAIEKIIRKYTVIPLRTRLFRFIKRYLKKMKIFILGEKR